MQFTLSTKPLQKATDLGIIKANITKFYKRSNLVQLTANRNSLVVNIEAAGIKTQMTLPGSGDSDTTAIVILDCATFKGLIDSIDTEIMTIEYVSGGIQVYSGSSKFTVPQLIDATDLQLDAPTAEYSTESAITINPAEWQFVRDHQMYAIAKKGKHPVYENVWVGENKDTLVGDYDISLFTYSKYGNFDKTCLFPASIVNLFASIPEGSTITPVGKSYVLTVETDSYSLVTEISPKYEDDDSVGSYNSAIILGMLNHPDQHIQLDVGQISKFIGQTSLLKTNTDVAYTFAVENGEFKLSDRSNSYTASVDSDLAYTVKFKADLFKNAISNFDSDVISIAPIMRNDRAIGCLFWTDTLTTLLAGMG